MQRFWATVVVVAACSSPPDTCDQNVVDDVAKIAATVAPAPATTMQVHLMDTITCAGGGSGSRDISGSNQGWQGTFMFDGCTTTVDQDTLTLTGTLTFQLDDVNGVDFGTSAMLTIHGTVAGCSRPIDETCAVSWGDGAPPARTGTLCGRHFP